MTAKHSQATIIHRVHAWEHADAAARMAQSVTVDDLGMVSWQQDTDVLYLLVDTGPTWVQLNDFVGSLNQASHTDTTWYTILEIDIATDTAFVLDIMVAGYDVTNGQQWGYQFYGYAMNDSGTTTATTGTLDNLVEADAAYEARINPDDGNDRVQIQVRRNGGVDYDINWTARVKVAIA
jgi:hypothetical protein